MILWQNCDGNSGDDTEMYLSRVVIDTRLQQAMRALSNPEILHGMVEACFPQRCHRDLWRLDVLRGQICLLLLSREAPDLSPLTTQIGVADEPPQTRDYQPLLDRIKPGTAWRFRLTANPVTSVPSPNKKRGRVKAITIAAHQREWLVGQAEKHGFLLSPEQYDVVQSEWRIFRRQGQTVSILSATFEGILTVTEPELFCRALTEGIGRGKAYGMGMMTVMAYG